jgi:hypothetical protein
LVGKESDSHTRLAGSTGTTNPRKLVLVLILDFPVLLLWKRFSLAVETVLTCACISPLSHSSAN